MIRFIFTLWVVLLLGGCAACENLRTRMEHTVAPPEGIQQTQFAYIGDIDTDRGVFHVATQRLVLTGMLAPRGLPHRLLVFDHHAHLVATYEYDFNSSEPLWCAGSRVYLGGFGSFRNVRIDPRLAHLTAGSEPATGNVLDFIRGPNDPLLTRAQRYGSSGGIDDDPWAMGVDHPSLSPAPPGIPPSLSSLSTHPVLGMLGVPLGTVVEIRAQVVAGSELGAKAYGGSYLLRVNEVDGRPLAAAPVMEFSVLGFFNVSLANNEFALYKLKTGTEAHGLDSAQIAELEKGYVGKLVHLVVYETGCYSGVPRNLPGKMVPWQGHSFAFSTSLMVLAEEP